MAEEFNVEEVIPKLTENGYKVIKSDEYESTLNNLRENAVKEVQDSFKNEFTTNFHNKFEESIKDVVGFEKGSNQKSYDYAVEALKKFKAEKEELKKALEEGGDKEKILGQYKDRISELENALKDKDSKFSEEKSNMLKSNLFESEISKIKFPDGFPERAKKALISELKNNVISGSKIDENGNLILLDSEGKQMLNKDKQMEALTLSDYLTTELSEVLTEQKKAATPSDPNPTNPKSQVNDLAVEVVSTNPTTYNEAMNKLAELRMSKGLTGGDAMVLKAAKFISEKYK